MKYCHPIFDNKYVRRECGRLLLEAFSRYEIRHREVGFDRNHVHGLIEIGNYSRPEAAKLLRGYTGKKLLARFPEMKRVCFWGSGLWSPAYFMDSVGKDMEFMQNYVKKQRYYVGIQSKISDY